MRAVSGVLSLASERTPFTAESRAVRATQACGKRGSVTLRVSCARKAGITDRAKQKMLFDSMGMLPAGRVAQFGPGGILRTGCRFASSGVGRLVFRSSIVLQLRRAAKSGVHEFGCESHLPHGQGSPEVRP